MQHTFIFKMKNDHEGNSQDFELHVKAKSFEDAVKKIENNFQLGKQSIIENLKEEID